MKKILVLAALLFLGIIRLASPEALSEQLQQELLDRLRYLKGEGPLPASLEGVELPHCGTQVAFDVFINRGNFTGKYATLAEQLEGRPDSSSLPNHYISHDSLFRVHYTISGNAAVYQINVDTLNGGDGIPDYVNKVADIADSVWAFEVDHLGFQPPPSDGVNGGDSLMDIYILALSSSYYGYVEPEEALTNQRATSFIVLDNDYDIWPYNNSDEMDRRLDAARVTMAHEFFHTIHYGMDYTEYETHNDVNVLYWWEMSAVWMEEMAYDDINDYYAYLPSFYEYPWLGLQAVPPFNTLHQYGAAVFPIFLTEKFDTVIVRDIWERCRDYGIGSNFPQAANDAIVAYTDSIYNDPASADSGNPEILYDLRKAFNEFAVWNLFTGTGDRASQAPDGFGFSEAGFYPEIGDGQMISLVQYEGSNLLCQPDWPDTLGDGTSIEFFKNNKPQNLGAHYLNMHNINLIADSLFTVVFFGDPLIDWNISFVGFPLNGADPATVAMLEQADTNVRFEAATNQYQNIIAIPSPISTNINFYPEKFCYAMLFLDTIIPPKGSYVISSPYPNPIRAYSNDDYVTFRARVVNALLLDKPAKMEITILNVAGEKIKRVTSEYDDLHYGPNDISVVWNLDNQSGKKIAPGVYLAYCELIFGDGTPTVSEKYKISVIK